MSTSKYPLRRLRAAMVLAAVSALVALPVASATAEASDPTSTVSDEPTPADEPTNYVPTPSIDVKVHQPICDGDVPYLQYEVDVTGTSHATTTITWINPDGADVLQADLPLSGRVLWPGAKVDAQGKPTDWPGWRLENGTWLEGDEFDWVRQPTQVLFAVNPEETVTVTYPPSSPNCSTNPPGTDTDLNVRTLTPVCIDGVPYVDYVLSVKGTPEETATLTWHNPTGGADVVQPGMPLAGRVLWPGAYPTRDADLPAHQGWQLVNNFWMNTGQYPWAVGTLDLTFTVNPARTVQVKFPSGENCLTAAQSPPPTPINGSVSRGDSAGRYSGPLAQTGAQVATVAGIAAAGIAIGTVVVLMARRRTHES